jgi:hypothetical protein
LVDNISEALVTGPDRGTAGGGGRRRGANLLLVLRELNHAGVDELRPRPDGTLVPAASDPGLAAVPGLLVLRIGAPIYTANARGIQGRVLVGVAQAAVAAYRARAEAGSESLPADR